VTRLLRQGYVVQQNQDKTVTFWQSNPERAAAAQANPAREHARLVKMKAVTEEGIKQALVQAAASSAQAPTAPASSAQGGTNP